MVQDRPPAWTEVVSRGRQRRGRSGQGAQGRSGPPGRNYSSQADTFSPPISATAGHLDNPNGAKRFGRRVFTGKMCCFGFAEPMPNTTKTRPMPYRFSVEDILESAGIDLRTILSIQEFFQERFYLIEFIDEHAFRSALMTNFSAKGSAKSITMVDVNDEVRIVRRRLGGIPSYLSRNSIDKAINATQPQLPPHRSIVGNIHRVETKERTTARGTTIPPYPTGDVCIDLILDEHAEPPSNIWVNIHGKHEGFALLREGRQPNALVMPDLCNLPADLLEKEENWRRPGDWEGSQALKSCGDKVREPPPPPSPPAPAIPPPPRRSSAAHIAATVSEIRAISGEAPPQHAPPVISEPPSDARTTAEACLAVTTRVLATHSPIPTSPKEGDVYVRSPHPALTTNHIEPPPPSRERGVTPEGPPSAVDTTAPPPIRTTPGEAPSNGASGGGTEPNGPPPPTDTTAPPPISVASWAASDANSEGDATMRPPLPADIASTTPPNHLGSGGDVTEWSLPASDSTAPPPATTAAPCGKSDTPLSDASSALPHMPHTPRRNAVANERTRSSGSPSKKREAVNSTTTPPAHTQPKQTKLNSKSPPPLKAKLETVLLGDSHVASWTRPGIRPSLGATIITNNAIRGGKLYAIRDKIIRGESGINAKQHQRIIVQIGSNDFPHERGDRQNAPQVKNEVIEIARLAAERASPTSTIYILEPVPKKPGSTALKYEEPSRRAAASAIQADILKQQQQGSERVRWIEFPMHLHLEKFYHDETHLNDLGCAQYAKTVPQL